MAIEAGTRFSVPFGWAMKHGALGLGVEPYMSFENRDQQERDKQSGAPLWTVTVVDLDPDARKFGRSSEVKVRVAAHIEPVLPPDIEVGGVEIRPPVAFTDMTVLPYVDGQKCRAPGRCGGRLAWSYRASGLVAPQELPDAA